MGISERGKALNNKRIKPPERPLAPNGDRSLTYSSPAIRDRRRRILEETRNLIAEEGIGDFSMHELCKRAGVAKRTLYNAFQTRERLIAVAIHEYFTDYLARINYHSEVGTLRHNVERIIAVTRRNRKIRNYIRAILAIYFSPEVNFDIWETMHGMGTGPNLEWIRRLHARRQLQPWIDPDELADDLVRYEYATMNEWARGQLSNEEIIPRLLLSYLTFMVGATRGAARSEILTMIDTIVRQGVEAALSDGAPIQKSAAA